MYSRNSRSHGSLPGDDGWAGLYRLFDRLAPRGSRLRGAICAYFEPSRLERSGDGRLFRVLGVGVFGRFTPCMGFCLIQPHSFFATLKAADNKVHSLNALTKHVINRITTTATNSYYLNHIGLVFGQVE